MMHECCKQYLASRGMSVIPTAVLDEMRNTEGETIVILGGRPLIVAPASPSDVDRIQAGILLDEGDGHGCCKS